MVSTLSNASNHLKQDGFYIANVTILWFLHLMLVKLKQDGFYIANVSNHLKQDVSTLVM